MSDSDYAFGVLDNIQYSILNMTLEQQVSLLNDCLGALNSIRSQSPKMMNLIQNTFMSESHLLKGDSKKLLEECVDTFQLRSANLLIKPAQMGGDDNDQLATTNVQMPTLFTHPTAQRTAQNSQLSPPINTASAMANIAANMHNLSPEVQLEFMKAMKLAIVNEGAVANQQVANEQYINRLHISGMVFSFTAPGAVMYYFQSLMDKAAVGMVFAAGNLAADTTGAVELGIRNAIPYALSVVRSAGSSAKWMLPESVFSMLKTASDSIPSQMSSFAAESITGSKIEEVTVASAEVTAQTIFLGCILIYIICVLFLAILTTLIVKLYSTKKIKIIGFEVAFGGRKHRQTRRRPRKRNNKHRRTRRKLY